MVTRVGILTIGRELLTGRVVNTNAADLAHYLLRQGVRVDRQMTVSDDCEVIAATLRYLSLPHDRSLVITCGGLGPTPDDLTLEGIGLAWDRLLHLHEEALRYVTEAYLRAGLDPESDSEVTRKMAYLPVGAIPLANPVGIAPAVVLTEDIRTLIALPGVPRELKGFLDSGLLLPYLRPYRSFSTYREVQFFLQERDERRVKTLLRPLLRSHRGGFYFKTSPRNFTEPLRLVVELWGDEEEVEENLRKIREFLQPHLEVIS